MYIYSFYKGAVHVLFFNVLGFCILPSQIMGLQEFYYTLCNMGMTNVCFLELNVELKMNDFFVE